MQERLWQEQLPDRRTIQRLVAKFRETGSVADAHKGEDQNLPCIAAVSEELILWQSTPR